MERHPRATPTQPAWNSNITEQCGRGRPCAPSVSTPYRVPPCVRVRVAFRISYISFRAHTGHALYTYTHTRARTHPRARCAPDTAAPHAPPQHSLADARVAVASLGRFLRRAYHRPPFASRQSLVRAYISKPVVTAPPRRYLSHASGADFYRRRDSRGKFIKSPSPSFRGRIMRFHGD